MIDDEFEVCFELLITIMLAKRRMYKVPVRVYLPIPYPGGARNKSVPVHRVARYGYGYRSKEYMLFLIFSAPPGYGIGR
jgi:hypothetical protein